ncbi:ABC transporter permease [Paenibacillus xylaniclasticus]|uniref:ABC transporter permease n=1 Tax=Paenibacillus xylaniclasticus TaxID=588083 RepID=UPI000FDCCCBE|nr:MULTISPECIES: ABC transporter permease [Paenibacillus]GFN30814.1 hypothetical protein PCURB6_10740 [Paenibacillus curdlanolyticus]
MLMVSLVRNEWMKIFSRPRSWIFILLIVASTMVPVIVSIVKPDDSTSWQEELTQENDRYRAVLNDEKASASDGERQTLAEQIAINEYRLTHDLPPYQSPWAIVNELSVFIPMITLFTVITAADAVAGEFAGGTIKMLLTRPVSRSRVLLSKYLGSFSYGAMLLAILFLTSLVIGVIMHGFGGLTDPYLYVTDEGVQESTMLLHCLKLYGYKSVHLLMIATLAFMISTVFRGVNLAIVTAVTLLLSGNLIVLMLSDYTWAKYLFFANTDMTMYLAGGETPFAGMSIWFSIAVLATYYVLFIAISWAVFTKREVAAA